MSDTATSADAISWENRITGGLSAIGLDGAQALYAFKVMVAAGITMFLAFLVDLPNTYWALLTLPLVATQQSGTTVWRSAARVGGTLTGAAVVLFFIGLFAQNGLVMIACLALWIFGCGYNARSQVGFDGYAYGTAGLTALVVAIDTGANAQMGFFYAYWRSTETIIAVIASFMVLLTIFPRSVGDDLIDNFTTATGKVLDLLRDAARINAEQSAKARLGAATSLDGLFTLLRAQKLERAHSGPDFTRVRTATARLDALYIDTGALSTVVAQATDEGILDGDLEAKRSRFSELIEDVPSPLSHLETAGDRITALRDYAETIDRKKAMKAVVLSKSKAERAEGLLLFWLRQSAISLAATLEAAAAVADPKRDALPEVSFSTRYPDRSAAIQRGLRPASAFVCVGLFWIFSAWSNGAILALITGALSLLIPTILPRAMFATAGIKIFMGFLSGGIIALMLMLMLPYMTGFTGFLTLFLPTIFVIFYVCKGPNRAVALGSTIMLAIALQPSNTQVYDPARLINTVMTLMIMPAAFISAMYIIFPENTAWLRRHLNKAGTKLLRSAASGRARNENTFLAQAIDVVADYGGDLDMDNEGDARLVKRVRAITQAGRELIAIERLRRHNRLPARLKDDLPKVREAMANAALKHSGEDTSEEIGVLEQARIHAAELLSDSEISALKQSATLRYALAIEQIRTLVELGGIALPRKNAHAS
ncbi:FUSC family protein [Fulvimarina sp. MAC3]|uniref:FUSC family protein n=1 Tax=Fulvimarina sp. MAC3 TaxID=3148887 RepID=UPI0031FD087B